MQIEIFNKTEVSFAEENLKKEIRAFGLKLQKKYAKKIFWISLVFVDTEEMQKLSEKFAHKNEPTDILTFPEDNQSVFLETLDFRDKPTNEKEKKTEPTIGGDIAICLEIVKQNAKKENQTFGFVLYETILHGLLHLCGLKHDYSSKSLSKVHKLQQNLLKELLKDKNLKGNIFAEFDL